MDESRNPHGRRGYFSVHSTSTREKSRRSSQRSRSRSPEMEPVGNKRYHDTSTTRDDSRLYSGRDRRRRRRDESIDDVDRRQQESRRPRDYRYRDRSQSSDFHSRAERSKSPLPRTSRIGDHSRPPQRKSGAPLPSQEASFRAERTSEGQPPIPDKQKPNFNPTGILAREANTVAGTSTVLKYHEPPEARKPPSREAWRLYVFKDNDLLDTVFLFQRSAWLVGRDQRVTDYHIEHSSVSKQHAVIQFRHRTSKNEFGDVTSKVKPYLIDLDSANGTRLDGKKVEPSRFVELIDQDVIKFGDSERDYVIMLPPADK